MTKEEFQKRRRELKTRYHGFLYGGDTEKAEQAADELLKLHEEFKASGGLDEIVDHVVTKYGEQR